jgi:hypothetical protein
MPRFRNNDGNVLVVNDLGRTVGPYEEFDFPGYDPEVHGPVAGCTRTDTPESPPAAKPAARPAAGTGADKDKESGE